MKPLRASPHTASLSPSQLKALLVVASGAAFTAGVLRDHPHADLLEQAAEVAATVDALTAIKERAKILIKDAADSHDREAATLLYHVAVAAAFVRHDTVISSRPMRRQLALYERFAAEWAGDPIGALFREALTRLAAEPLP
jgi:hypothetical protein